MQIKQEQADFLKNKYKTDGVGILAWEAFLAEQRSPGSSDRLIADVVAVLSGDSLMADRAQSEGGQPSVVPNWFYEACDLLKKQGHTSKTVELFMKSKVSEVANVAAENQRKADSEE